MLRGFVHCGAVPHRQQLRAVQRGNVLGRRHRDLVHRVLLRQVCLRLGCIELQLLRGGQLRVRHREQRLRRDSTCGVVHEFRRVRALQLPLRHDQHLVRRLGLLDVRRGQLLVLIAHLVHHDPRRLVQRRGAVLAQRLRVRQVQHGPSLLVYGLPRRHVRGIEHQLQLRLRAGG